MISGVHLITIPRHQDARGSLIALDRDQSLPFDIKRVIVVSTCPESAIRGEHATSGHLALLALAGSVTVDLDNGEERLTLQLARADQVLCVHAGVWLRLRNFEPSSIVMAAFSERYWDVKYYNEPQPDLLREMSWEACP